MAFIIRIFAKMHSVSYGQGVMKYKSNCPDIYSKTCLKLEGYLIQNAMEILISVIKRVVYKILV